jgi:hypothetical protein
MSDPAFLWLVDLLEEERELLQSGRPAEAAQLVDAKMEALEAFEGFIAHGGLSNASAEKRRAAEKIVQLAEENAAHMSAIRNGLRHAISRLENLNAAAHVGSYGRGGAQLSFTNATGTFNRRA